jgi:hypothetical protein
METGIFSAATLDDPNQIETVRQIRLFAQRDLAVLRARGEAAHAAISLICRPSGKSLGLPWTFHPRVRRANSLLSD